MKPIDVAVEAYMNSGGRAETRIRAAGIAMVDALTYHDLRKIGGAGYDKDGFSEDGMLAELKQRLGLSDD